MLKTSKTSSEPHASLVCPCLTETIRVNTLPEQPLWPNLFRLSKCLSLLTCKSGTEQRSCFVALQDHKTNWVVWIQQTLSLSFHSWLLLKSLNSSTCSGLLVQLWRCTMLNLDNDTPNPTVPTPTKSQNSAIKKWLEHWLQNVSATRDSINTSTVWRLNFLLAIWSFDCVFHSFSCNDKREETEVYLTLQNLTSSLNHLINIDDTTRLPFS